MQEISNITKHLGQKSEYKTQYDPSLLVKEPRQANRTYLGIQNDNLPFVGYDTWNAYEISGLVNNGVPVTGVAKIVYPCNNDYIVESKSLKLYFNSFNMTKLGNSAAEVRNEIENRTKRDLSELLGTNVDVSIISDSKLYSVNSNLEDPYFKKFITLEDQPILGNVDVYQETPSLLDIVDNSEGYTHYLHSALLKSNCKVTTQADWGDVFITFKGDKVVSDESLLKYIISFRDENHFHEEITEAIYKRLWDLGIFTDLHVMCLYVRRGGIDICPQRANKGELLHKNLMNANIYHDKTPRQ